MHCSACSDVCSVHWPPVVQRCKLRSSPDIMSISMHQWNSEKKQCTFPNSQWAAHSLLSQYLYSSDLLFSESSFDRLGTGNVICYLPGVLSVQTGESWPVTECRQAAPPPLPPSLKSYKILQLSQRSEETIHVTRITQLWIETSKLQKNLFAAVN